MNELAKKRLQMEDVLERQIEIEKEALEGESIDLSDRLKGWCVFCERPYYASFVIPVDGGEPHTKPEEEPEGYCIPCWRQENDLPKAENR